MKYQDFSGVDGWFDDAVDSVKSAVTSVADWTSETASGGYDWVSAKAGELTDTAMNTLKDFETKMNKLIAIQKQVDQAIASLPENSALCVRLEKQRDESRGYFSNYILPAWQAFQEWAGNTEEAHYGSYDSGLGIVVTGTMVITAGAVLSVVSIAITYLVTSYSLESKILEDPELKQQYAVSKANQMGDFMTIAKYGGLAVLGIVALSTLNSFRSNR